MSNRNQLSSYSSLNQKNTDELGENSTKIDTNHCVWMINYVIVLSPKERNHFNKYISCQIKRFLYQLQIVCMFI